MYKRLIPSQHFRLANWRPSRHNIIFTLFFTLLSCDSFAEWTRVGRTSEATIFFDQETIRRSGQLVKMWTLTNFTISERIEGKQYQSAKTQFEYDCREERSRVLAATFYSLLNGAGVVTASESNIEPWYPIAPKTIAVKLWKYACGKPIQ